MSWRVWLFNVLLAAETASQIVISRKDFCANESNVSKGKSQTTPGMATVEEDEASYGEVVGG